MYLRKELEASYSDGERTGHRVKRFWVQIQPHPWPDCVTRGKAGFSGAPGVSHKTLNYRAAVNLYQQMKLPLQGIQHTCKIKVKAPNPNGANDTGEKVRINVDRAT